MTQKTNFQVILTCNALILAPLPLCQSPNIWLCSRVWCSWKMFLSWWSSPKHHKGSSKLIELTCPSYCRPRPGCPPSRGNEPAWQDRQLQQHPDNCRPTLPATTQKLKLITCKNILKQSEWKCIPAASWCRQTPDFHPNRGNSSFPPVAILSKMCF